MTTNHQIRDAIRVLLRNSAEFEIVDEGRNGIEAVKKTQKQTLDLVFLDVQIPGFGAFVVMEKIGVNQMPATILLSADDRSALRAFSVQAIDYLIKPFDQEVFDRVLECAGTHVRRRRLDGMSRQMFGFLENLYSTQSPADRIEKRRVIASPA